MDFDSHGNLWILALTEFDFGGVPDAGHTVFRLNMRTGQITESMVGYYAGLAVRRGSVGVLAGVPALDAVGLALLGAMPGANAWRIGPL